MNQVFKLKLTFLSLVSFSALVGFCSGVIAIPIAFIKVIHDGEMGLAVILFIIFALPVTGLLNGGLCGALAYPLYRWVSERIGFKYKGTIYELRQ